MIRKPAGNPQNADVTVVRGVDKSQVFTDWVKTTLAEQKPDEEHPDLTVTQYDEKGQPAHRITLNRARVTRWDGAGLDASSGEPAKETVTIAYSEITIE
ncbi:phage tail protein [Streptomyces sp. NPDC002054]|uniref:phage tail protein n=1 Tax=Streptomyces sp. NPDC002054 TaxID=3154663 RepID=UPI003327286B